MRTPGAIWRELTRAPHVTITVDALTAMAVLEALQQTVRLTETPGLTPHRQRTFAQLLQSQLANAGPHTAQHCANGWN